jgi:hypothetical protein
MNAYAFGTTMVILVAFLTLAFAVGSVISLVWVYKDSEARGKTGCMWLLIAFFTWPWGVIAYYMLRDKEIRL